MKTRFIKRLQVAHLAKLDKKSIELPNRPYWAQRTNYLSDHKTDKQDSWNIPPRYDIKMQAPLYNHPI